MPKNSSRRNRAPRTTKRAPRSAEEHQAQADHEHGQVDAQTSGEIFDQATRCDAALNIAKFIGELYAESNAYSPAHRLIAKDIARRVRDEFAK